MHRSPLATVSKTSAGKVRGIHKRAMYAQGWGAGVEGARDMQSLAMTEGPLWQALRQAWQTVFLPERCYRPLHTPEPLIVFAVASLCIAGQLTGIISAHLRIQRCHAKDCRTACRLQCQLQPQRRWVCPEDVWSPCTVFAATSSLSTARLTIWWRHLHTLRSQERSWTSGNPTFLEGIGKLPTAD